MKKNLIKQIAVRLVGMMIFTACGKVTPTITVTTKKIQVKVGEFRAIELDIIAPEGASIKTHYTKNKEIATVDRYGVVTGIQIGETQVIAKSTIVEKKNTTYNAYQ